MINKLLKNVLPFLRWFWFSSDPVVPGEKQGSNRNEAEDLRGVWAPSEHHPCDPQLFLCPQWGFLSWKAAPSAGGRGQVWEQAPTEDAWRPGWKEPWTRGPSEAGKGIAEHAQRRRVPAASSSPTGRPAPVPEGAGVLGLAPPGLPALLLPLVTHPVADIWVFPTITHLPL